MLIVMKINFLFLNFKSVLTCEVLIHFQRKTAFQQSGLRSPKETLTAFYVFVFPLT